MKRETVLLSVIVPVFEDYEFLEESLGSLFTQTIIDDIEIICVDDFSQDGSRELLVDLSNKHSNMKVILLDENSSASECRRRGVLASKGEYIMFMDGDDYFSSNACEVAYNAIKTKKVDILQFETVIENCGNVPESRIKMNENLLKPYHKKDLKGNLLSYCFCEKKFPVNVWNKIYNGEKCRSSFEKAVSYYLPKANDLYATFLILDGSNSYAAISDKLYHYCFGRGMTGRTEMTLESFELCCQSARVYDALNDYIKKYRNYKAQEYSPYVESIKKRFIVEQMNKLNSSVPVSRQSEAYKLFYYAWRKDLLSLVSYLASRNWYNKNQIAKVLKDSSVFKFKRREIKTIALYYRNIKNGGAQRVVADTANMFANVKNADGTYKYSVILITDEVASSDDYKIDDRVCREVIADSEKYIVDKYNVRAKRIIEVLDIYNIDLFINSQWMNDTNFWDMLVIKGHPSHPAYINHCHNYFGYFWKLSYDKVGESWNSFAMMDALIVLSTNDRFYWSNINKNTYFIKNSCCFTSEVYNTVSRTETEKYILWIARFAYEKQPAEMLKIMQHVAKSVPNAVCHMVGAGNEKLFAQLKALVISRGLEKNIVFEGFSLEVEKFYRKADVFVSTSQYEGYPLTFMESAAFGIPSVSYDMPWLEYYKMIDGYSVVPQLDSEGAANKIIKLLTDKNYYNDQSARVYNSFVEQEKVTIDQKWSEVIYNLENGITPDIDYSREEIKTAFDAMVSFHSISINTFKEKIALAQNNKFCSKIRKVLSKLKRCVMNLIFLHK